MHDQENLFDYTPVSFSISIPEGKYLTIDNFFAKFYQCYEILSKSKNIIRDKSVKSTPFD